MQRQRRRIGAGHRRAPGDMVTGTYAGFGGEFIGRIVYATNRGDVTVRLDDGRQAVFSAHKASRALRTIDEVDASAKRGDFGFGWVLDETPRAA